MEKRICIEDERKKEAREKAEAGHARKRAERERKRAERERKRLTERAMACSLPDRALALELQVALEEEFYGIRTLLIEKSPNGAFVAYEPRPGESMLTHYFILGWHSGHGIVSVFVSPEERGVKS